jgi:hypothetical protein
MPETKKSIDSIQAVCWVQVQDKNRQIHFAINKSRMATLFPIDFQIGFVFIARAFSKCIKNWIKKISNSRIMLGQNKLK